MRGKVESVEGNDQILETYEVMRQLRPNVPKSRYVRIVRLQEAEGGFKLAALRENGKITCVAGFRVCHSLGWGKFLYVDDLVTDKRHRSTGAGKAMFRWLVEHARKEGCRQLRLDSAVWRHRAHRFYLREGMDIDCFHFSLNLAKADECPDDVARVKEGESRSVSGRRA
jgi:GNAT superfamily N-acetyltransferase